MEERNRDLSSFTNFSRAIKGQNFSKDKISRWFNILVEKNDYNKKDKKVLIQNLVNLTNSPEGHRISG